MMSDFYPEPKHVPAGHQTDEFILRPLRTTDVELDYNALMVSNEMLHKWGGGSWPAGDFTLAENLVDLDQHEREHLVREAFTFTVMDIPQKTCLGCVYFDPLIKLLETAEDLQPQVLSSVSAGDVLVRFWVRQPEIDNDLDRQLLKSLMKWLVTDWTFDRVFFRANEMDRRQITLLEEVELPLVHVVQVPERNGRFQIYGPLSRALIKQED